MAFAKADPESQLLGFMDEVSEAFQKGSQEDVLIMGFSRVFDKVWHSLLIHKLQQYGIFERVNRWTEYQLHGHTRRTEMETEYPVPMSLMSATKPAWPWASSDHQWEAEKCSIQDIPTSCARVCQSHMGSLHSQQHQGTEKGSEACNKMGATGLRRSVFVDTMREQLRKQPRLTTFYKFHHGLAHIRSKHCPSWTDRPWKTTQNTHHLTYDIPTHQTAYKQKIFFPRIILEWTSLPQDLHCTRPWFIWD